MVVVGIGGGVSDDAGGVATLPVVVLVVLLMQWALVAALVLKQAVLVMVPGTGSGARLS